MDTDIDMYFTQVLNEYSAFFAQRDFNCRFMWSGQMCRHLRCTLTLHVQQIQSIQSNIRGNPRNRSCMSFLQEWMYAYYAFSLFRHTGCRKRGIENWKNYKTMFFVAAPTARLCKFFSMQKKNFSEKNFYRRRGKVCWTFELQISWDTHGSLCLPCFPNMTQWDLG